ncbi:MAG: DHA2 family efflux MFS transporter permease subunit [Dehalococcoidia bacterium]
MNRLPYKYIVGIIFVFGMFMELLDMTITNVALPTLSEEFDAGTSSIQWVVTGYLLGLAVFIPFSGWIGDRWGTKKTFMLALTVFTLASLACAAAWSIESLIFFRVVQGVGGGMLVPVGTAMLYRAFPPDERAQGAAIFSIPIAVAPASGPVLGGYLVEYWSWPWIFLINIPIGIAALAMAFFFLKEEKQESPGRLDVPGFVLSAAGLGSLLYALSRAGDNGWTDSQVLLFGSLGVLMIASFCITELRTREPMIDIRLFKNALFRAGNTVQFVAFASFAGALFLLPLLLQAERGLGALESGLVTFPQAIGVGMTIPIAGRVYGHIGPRRMLIVGMTMVSLTTLAFAFVEFDTSLWWIRGLMWLRGVAFAITMVPMQTATFATISLRDTGRASALFNTGRQVSASFGVALLATVLTDRLAFHGAALGPDGALPSASLDAFQEAFIVATVLGLIGIVAALMVSDKAAAPSMRRAQKDDDTVLKGEPEPMPVGGAK